MRCQPELLLVSGCSGHADQNRPSPMQLAGFCSYQSDCMSLRAHRHLPCALCCRHACLVLKTDERRSGSIDGEAHRMHHLQQGGADDVTELLIAALAASTHHADRPWQRRPGLQAPAMRWQLELRLVSGCSSRHADQNRLSASTAGSCIYLSNCMSLPADRHLLHDALCWLAWCSRQTSEAGARDRRRTRLMQGCCCGRHRSTCGLLIRATFACTACTTCRQELMT